MENKIIIDNKAKDKYNILFEVDADNQKEKYVVYTKDKKNKNGETITYAAKYTIKNGQQVLSPIKDEDILEYLDGILLQVQSKMKKKKGE